MGVKSPQSPVPVLKMRWVEVCFCPTPLQEERPYWEEYFDLDRVQDAHDRNRCRDLNGQEPWACTGLRLH